jgi:alpha-galactosidase
MSDDDVELLSEAIERHKVDRDIWHQGRFSRLRTVDPGLTGMMAISLDQRQARLVVAQADRPEASLPPRLSLPGLIGNQPYRVKLQYASETVDRANRRFGSALWAEGLMLSGEALAKVGLNLPILYAQTGLAIAIDAIQS